MWLGLVSVLGLVIIGALAPPRPPGEAPPVNEPARSGAAPTRPQAFEPPAQSPEREQVGIAHLLGDYDTNEIAADRRYKDRLIETSGYVTSIDKGPLGGMYLTLGATAERFQSPDLRCALVPSEEDEAARVRKGSWQAVTGEVSGLTMLSVFLKDCELR